VVRAGLVGRPHGLDGSFYVAQPIAALLTLGAEVSVGGRAAAIERRAGTDERPIVRIAGCSDRDAAAALRGTALLATAEAAPPLGPDEWYAHELVGCAVRDGAVEVGEVRGLRALPSCEVLEVARAGGGDELLVPLVRDAVRSVDVDARAIDVDLAFLGEA
jgi:16S rRNA processing protein RimM